MLLRGRGVRFLVNRETLLELRSGLRSDALPAITIDLSGIWTYDLLNTNRVYSNQATAAPGWFQYNMWIYFAQQLR